MKRGVLALILVAISSISLFSAEITIRGIYQGENIFVNNPIAPSGVGFCVYEVDVNGMLTTDEISSSSFEIDLSVYKFALGADVSIDIKYKDGCKPMVLNAEAVSPKASFQLLTFECDGKNVHWSTSDELGKLPFVIEQFKWNKWIKVGIVTGKGGVGPNEYSTPVRLNTGKNKFRIKQTDAQGGKKISREIERVDTRKEVTFSPRKVDNEISFSEETMYEIYDEFGMIVFKGYSAHVSCANLKKGKYFLNYDNTMGEFTKK